MNPAAEAQRLARERKEQVAKKEAEMQKRREERESELTKTSGLFHAAMDSFHALGCPPWCWNSGRLTYNGEVVCEAKLVWASYETGSDVEVRCWMVQYRFKDQKNDLECTIEIWPTILAGEMQRYF